jgi:4-oxalocrotonate tautomerase
MPHVQVTLLKGRTTEQKRKIAERITDAIAEEAGTNREGIVITFIDVERDSYARGGMLMADKK